MQNSKFQIKAGQSVGLDSAIAEQGQLLFTTDEGIFYVDTTDEATGRIAVNGDKAKKDWKGQQIDSTYIKGLSVSGKVITYTRGDGTTGTITTQDTNTQYKAGNGLVFNATDNKQIDVNPGTGIVISEDKVTLATSGVAAAAYGPTSNASPAHGASFTVPSVTVDSYGRVTAASNISITLPTDNNTDTKMTQAYSTTNNSYPVLFSATSGITSTSSRGATTSIVNNQIYANPSTGTLTAKTFSGSLSGTATKADEWTNNVTLTIGNKSQAINGKAGTLTYSAADMGLSVVGHKHAAADITSGTLGVARGGTGITAVTAGGIAYGGSSAFAFSSQGTSGQLLTSGGSGAPTWTSPSSLSVKQVGNKLKVGSKEYNGSAEVTITAADLGLNNALHFIGVVSSLPTTGTDGDVVLLNGVEYVYSSTSSPKWVELGDESSHLKKDAVTISGTGALGGGGAIGSNAQVNITHNTTGADAKSNASQTKTISGSGGTGSFTIPIITVDAYGHTKYTGNSTITLTMPTLPTIPTHRTLAVKYSSDSTSIADGSAIITYNPTGTANQTLNLTTFAVASSSAAGKMGIVPAPQKGQVGANYVLGADKAWHAISSLDAVVWGSF